MKCDLCDKPAVVHEIINKDGVKTEVHLCEEHAIAANISPAPGHQPVKHLLTQFVISKGGRPTRTSKKVCESCGTSFAHFRQTGVVGCPECYETFEHELGPLIERAQNGATSHTGKCPKRRGASIDRQLLIQRMVKELEDAVAAEQYERAAQLRDQLHLLEVTASAEQAAEEHDEH